MTISFGKPIAPAGQGRADADRGKSRRGSRPRSRGSACRRVTADGRLAPQGHLRRPHGERRGDEGETRRIVLAGEERRLPAGPRAPALDRHADRPLRAHRARAALGDDPRDRGDARRARRVDPALARRMAGAAARRRCRANGRPARRSSTAGASWRSPCVPARRSARSRPTSSTSPCCTRAADDERQVATFVARWLRDEALSASCCRASPNTRRASRRRRRS